MMIGDAYQPLATRIMDAITATETDARALFDAHRLDRPGDLFTADELMRLASLVEFLSELGNAVHRALILEDHARTHRALIGAQDLHKRYARELRALQAKDGDLHLTA